MKTLLILITTILALPPAAIAQQAAAASTIDRGQAQEFSQAEIYQLPAPIALANSGTPESLPRRE